MIGLIVVAASAVVAALIAVANSGRTTPDSTTASLGPNTLEELFASRLARGELDQAGYLRVTGLLPFTGHGANIVGTVRHTNRISHRSAVPVFSRSRHESTSKVPPYV